MLFSILSRPGFLDSSAQFPFIDHFPPLVPLSRPISFTSAFIRLFHRSSFIHAEKLRCEALRAHPTSNSSTSQPHPGFCDGSPSPTLKSWGGRKPCFIFFWGGWLRLALLSLNLNKTTDLISPSNHESLIYSIIFQRILVFFELNWRSFVGMVGINPESETNLKNGRSQGADKTKIKAPRLNPPNGWGALVGQPHPRSVARRVHFQDQDTKTRGPSTIDVVSPIRRGELTAYSSWKWRGEELRRFYF